MKTNIPTPSFTIDPKTNEVRIPYDQFHTWMTEVVEKVNAIQAILGSSTIEVEKCQLSTQIREKWGLDVK